MPPIARNAPCPCGSGEKFKKCCLPFVGRWPIYDEHRVLSFLLGHSERFSRYYMARRPQLNVTLFWAMDTGLPPGIDHYVTCMEGNRAVIRLRRIPPTIDDEFAIAHELQHLLVDEESFPVTAAEEQYEYLSSTLNAVLHDPLANERLRAFGFDLAAHFLDEATRSQTSLTDNNGRPLPGPSNWVQQVHWTMNLLGLMLEHEAAFQTRQPSEFEVWFADCYPAVASEARRLLAMVHQIGYDTPAQCYEAFALLINELGLKEVVYLLSRSQCLTPHAGFLLPNA